MNPRNNLSMILAAANNAPGTGRKYGVPVDVLGSFLIALFAFFGILFPLVGLAQFVAVSGTGISLLIFIRLALNNGVGGKNLAKLTFYGSMLFWFWLEIFDLSGSRTPFSNFASYSPFMGATLPTNVVAEAIWLVSAFQALVAGLLALFSRISAEALFRSRYRNKVSFFRGGLILAVAMIGWLPFALTYGSIGAAISGMTSLRQEQIAFEAGLSSYLPIAGMAASGLAVFILLSRTSRASTILVLAAAVVGGMIALLSGTRFKVAYIFLPAVIGFLALNRGKRLSASNSLVIALTIILLVGITAFQFIYRYGAGSAETQGVISAVTAGAGHFTQLAHAIGIFEELHEPFEQSILSLFVTDYIPRFIWLEKPDHEYWEFYNARLAIAGNVTPSMLGQYYLNNGSWGFVYIGLIFSALLSLADRFICVGISRSSMPPVVIGAFVLTFIFLSFRVFSPNYATYPILASALSVLAYRRGGTRR